MPDAMQQGATCKVPNTRIPIGENESSVRIDKHDCSSETHRSRSICGARLEMERRLRQQRRRRRKRQRQRQRMPQRWLQAVSSSNLRIVVPSPIRAAIEPHLHSPPSAPCRPHIHCRSPRRDHSAAERRDGVKGRRARGRRRLRRWSERTSRLRRQRRLRLERPRVALRLLLWLLHPLLLPTRLLRDLRSLLSLLRCCLRVRGSCCGEAAQSRAEQSEVRRGRLATIIVANDSPLDSTRTDIADRTGGAMPLRSSTPPSLSHAPEAALPSLPMLPCRFCPWHRCESACLSLCASVCCCVRVVFLSVCRGATEAASERPQRHSAAAHTAQGQQTMGRSTAVINRTPMGCTASAPSAGLSDCAISVASVSATVAGPAADLDCVRLDECWRPDCASQCDRGDSDAACRFAAQVMPIAH